jgi:hypothetical protein
VVVRLRLDANGAAVHPQLECGHRVGAYCVAAVRQAPGAVVL